MDARHIFTVAGDADDPRMPARLVIGRVTDIGGSTARISLDGRALVALEGEADDSVAMAGQVGSHVKMKVGPLWLVARIRAMRLGDAESDLILADIDFLGEGGEAGDGGLVAFRRGVTCYPRPGCRICVLTDADIRQMYAADDRPHVEVGIVHPTAHVRGAIYVDAFLGKHFALLGSTGTGKSTAAALLLHRICDVAPEGHVVMIDPHGEYGAAFADRGEVLDVGNLAMPYWLMNLDEHAEVFVTTSGAERQKDVDVLTRCLLAARARNRAAEGLTRLTVDSPVPYLLSDFSNILQTEMGKLDKATENAPFLRLKARFDEIKADPRYGFMFSGMLVADNMAAFLARVFRLPAGGRPISIVDVSGVPSDIVSVVVSVLSRMIFDYALWSRGEPLRPVLLVCEEAHRYVPATQSGRGAAVNRVLERIAKEGRKYGVALGLITQRPSDLSEGVLSQCGTIIAMRLNNERDRAFVAAAMPEGAQGFLDAIPALRNRECVICGEGVSIPMRVSLDELEAGRRPASQDPVFSALWAQPGGDSEMLGRVVRRWRTQGR